MTAGEPRAAFSEAYGRTPTAVASAPGRVNLVGGHTDYNEGLVLPMAVDLRTAVALAPRDDGRIRLRSTEFADEVVVDGLPDDPIDDRDDSWANYPLGVLVELDAAGLAPVGDGLDLLVTGDVPQGAGLSSSAALEVATAAAAYGLDPGVETGTDLPKGRLAEAAWRAETGFVGLDCGIMDQYASALCRADEALFLDCRSRETERVPFPDDDYRVVVVDTRVEHELAASAYNDRVAECREAAERLNDLLGGVDTLRDVDRDDFLAHADHLSAPLRRRVRHVVTENERVRAAAAALSAGDFDAVGDRMYESHASLRDDYEVSCRELDAVVDVAWTTDGVVGARMTGGGFGGSVVALVAADAVDEFSARVDRALSEEADVHPRTFVCASAEGVRLE
ncbi:galactokinase [Salinigranum marinum]|uniref:galactokinase n=1 Tax=Salinigranum marinum TaxID=1515595 RepID=UPI002989A557|nr:galactokinase [Salinigranum marinum]